MTFTRAFNRNTRTVARVATARHVARWLLRLVRAAASRAAPLKVGLLLSTAFVVFLTTCLPSEPDPPVRIDFQLADTLTVAVGAEVSPSVLVLADSVESPDARYRLESLDPSVVTVDSARHAVRSRLRVCRSRSEQHTPWNATTSPVPRRGRQCA